MRKHFDISDILVFGGLVTVGAGVWMLSPAWALVVVGATLFGLGIVGSR